MHSHTYTRVRVYYNIIYTEAHFANPKAAAHRWGFSAAAAIRQDDRFAKIYCRVFRRGRLSYNLIRSEPVTRDDILALETNDYRRGRRFV